MTPINRRLGRVGEINRRSKRSYSNAVFCVSYVTVNARDEIAFILRGISNTRRAFVIAAWR